MFGSGNKERGARGGMYLVRELLEEKGKMIDKIVFNTSNLIFSS